MEKTLEFTVSHEKYIPVKQYTAKFNAKVALEATKDDKPLSEISSKYDVHPNQVRQWKKELLNKLPDILFGKRKKRKKQQEHNEAKLFEDIGRLKVEADWLKKNLISLTRSERKALINNLSVNISISRQCELLGISRSAYYYASVKNHEGDNLLKREINEIYLKHPFYGSRRISDKLKALRRYTGRYKT